MRRQRSRYSPPHPSAWETPTPSSRQPAPSTPEPAVDSVLDGASPSEPSNRSDVESARRLASDRNRPLRERLDAYEDLIDSEVGDTQLARARNIERETGMRQLFVKFEGGNPTGTQKDRIAFAQAMDALRRGYHAITVATCGNYGAAAAFAASSAGLRAVVYVPCQYQSKRLREIESHGAEIVRVDGDYESAVLESRRRAELDELYDANPGGINTVLQLQAYGQIAFEIYDELRDAPAIVAVPVSNGTTLAGIHHGFVSLYRRGKISRIPKMVAGSSHGKNPVVRAFRKGLRHCPDLQPEEIRETPVNEPLVNWHAIDGDAALDAVHATGGWASDASDKNMLGLAQKLREAEGLSVLPASTAGLLALLDEHKQEPLPPDRYVAVLTGRRA